VLTNVEFPFQAILHPFRVGLFYIIDKLLAVPTARVARKLAPLAFGTGLSLLGALPPNPHPSLNAISFPYSVLLSLIPLLSFT
jgi:hypothetical protein